jgi:hypothetical protein
MVLRVLRIIRTPLTLLILLGILCYGAWWGWTNIVAPPPAAPPTPCVETEVKDKALQTSQVTVRVYNGGDKKGLAGDVTRALRGKEFNVLEPANTEEAVNETVIIGNGAKNPEVLFVKSFFKGAKVEADERSDHSVDVMVGNKYAGFNSKAKTSYKVDTETVCLPEIAEPAGS